MRVISFQLTRPLRGATSEFIIIAVNVNISTHTPLAGRDQVCLRYVCLVFDFNSHAPCGARLNSTFDGVLKSPISTHTPLAGRDYIYHTPIAIARIFQLTRPLRGATMS